MRLWLPAGLEVMFFLPLSSVKRCFLWWLGESGQDAVVAVTQLKIWQINKAADGFINTSDNHAHQTQNRVTQYSNSMRNKLMHHFFELTWQDKTHHIWPVALLWHGTRKWWGWRAGGGGWWSRGGRICGGHREAGRGRERVAIDVCIWHFNLQKIPSVHWQSWESKVNNFSSIQVETTAMMPYMIKWYNSVFTWTLSGFWVDLIVFGYTYWRLSSDLKDKSNYSKLWK